MSHFDPDCVEKHNATHTRRMKQSQLGRDPPADGVSDDGHVFQVEVVEQGALKGGQAGDAVQSLWPRCPAKAWMGRCEDPLSPFFCKQLGERGD
jgi:hypothetical protein